MTKAEYEKQRLKALALYRAAGIVLTPAEQEGLEVADFGLGDAAHVGLNLVTFVNTERCCAKEMALLPEQTCPEHRHPPIEALAYPGKEETFRCRWGQVRLYVEGTPTPAPQGRPPAGYGGYTVFHEVLLGPGEQYTIEPDTKHWFQAGEQGAVVSEFSTKSLDEYDIFTDPAIQRIPVVE